MNKDTQRFIQHVFFFALLGTSAYLVWGLLYPFISSLALAAIVVVICYPVYERLLNVVPKRNETLAALLSVIAILFIIIAPIVILTSFILREAYQIYSIFSSADSPTISSSINSLVTVIQSVIPGFSIDVPLIIQQSASFIVNHLVSIFAGTASTLFLFLIALIASFYFFRDGKEFTAFFVKMSPLEDADDARIAKQLAVAIRSVAVGTISIAIIQGVLTAIGLSIFGFDRAILWGCVAAIGALVPGVGTAIVFIPSVIYLAVIGAHLPALFLALWGALAVGLIDNVLGPYVISRGNKAHPLMILLSVLGGIAMFGPLGFILGPVVLSLFLVLLELYNQQIGKGQSR